MAVITFPTSPTTNQTYTVGSKTWVWNGYAWDLQSANTAAITALAQAAYNQANTANSTDYTTISTTAGVYGNAAYHPVITVAANGRISSVVNTAIAISTTAITSGVLPFAQGGTNAASYTTGTLLTSNGTAIISLANTGTAGTYANAAYVPVITTDAYGRVSAVTNTIIQIAASQVTSGTLAIAQGGTNAATAPAAMANLMGYTSTVTAAGTTTLTNTSSYYQQFTGTTTQTVQLPVTSTLTTGWTFHIVNNSTGNLSVVSSGSNAVITVPSQTTAMVTCIGTTLTTAADWEYGITDFSSYTGTGSVVLSASPTFTGAPLAPTAATGTSNTQIATTAFAASVANDLSVAMAIALG